MSADPGDWDKFWKGVFATGVGSFVVGVFRIAILQKYGGWAKWTAALAGAVFVGVVAGLFMEDSTLSNWQRWGVIALCAFVADDLIVGLLSIAGHLRSDPLGFAARVFNAARGRHTEPPKEP